MASLGGKEDPQTAAGQVGITHHQGLARDGLPHLQSLENLLSPPSAPEIKGKTSQDLL